MSRKTSRTALAVLLFCLAPGIVFPGTINFNELNLSAGINSKKLLRLENGGSNIRRSSQLVNGLFDPNIAEDFGSYDVFLEFKYSSLGSNDDAVTAVGILGSIFTVGLGVFFLPLGEYRYELSVVMNIYDVNHRVVKTYRRAGYVEGAESAVGNRDYTYKAAPVYSLLLREITQAITDDAESINNLLRTAKYPPPPPLETAVRNSFNTLTAKIPSGSRIAVVGIDPRVTNGAVLTATLEDFFVNSGKYKIVDRRSIDAVIQELKLSQSVFTDPASAIRVGGFLSAQILIIGDVSGSGEDRRLVFRAISVRTAEIAALSSQKI
jgi:hypothetical protein